MENFGWVYGKFFLGIKFLEFDGGENVWVGGVGIGLGRRGSGSGSDWPGSVPVNLNFS
jgi:hypothetical protein